MANQLASLVVSIKANIGDFVNKIQDVVQQTNSMSGIIRQSADSVKTLENSMQALEVVSDAVTKAEQQLTLGLITNTQQVQDLKDNLTSTLDAVSDKAESVADSIGKLPPNFNNLAEALQRLDKMKELDVAMQGVTGGTRNLATQIANAKKQIDQMATSIMQAKTNAVAMNAVMAMQALPFVLLTGAVVYLKKHIIDFANSINNTFNGVPAILTAATVAFLTLSAAIGFCTTLTATWGSTWLYFKAAANTNLIIVGLETIIAKLGITTRFTELAELAMAKFNAMTNANKVAIIMTIVAAVLVTIYAIWQRWKNATDAVAENERRVKELNAETEKYNNALKETIKNHEKSLELVKKIREASKTTDQKVAGRENDLQAAINAHTNIEKRIREIRQVTQTLNAQLAEAFDANDTALTEELIKRRDAAYDTLETLQRQRDAIPKLTATEIAAQRATNINAEMGDRDIAKYLPQLDAIDEFARAQKEIQKMVDAGKISLEQRDAMMQVAQRTFEANDQEFQEAKNEAERVKNLITEYENAAKTPLQAFSDLADKLEEVRAQLSPEAYKTAIDKLNADLASQLGISKYLDESNDIAKRQKELAAVLNNLQTYYESGAISMQEMLEAQDRATAAFADQELKAEAAKNKPVAQTAAIERGTMAYYNILNQKNDPQLKESQKQTKTLETIAKNTAPQKTEQEYMVIA